MSAITIALFSAFIATSMGSIVLHKYNRALRARSQCFKFHELRDRLQILAVEGKIEIGASTYKFLQFTLNLCIRNAGTMKLSALLKLSKIIHRKMRVQPSHDVFSDLRTESEEVQELTADVFHELSCMLIVNDGFTMFLAKVIELLASELKGTFRRVAKTLLTRFALDHGKAVLEARNYQLLSAEIRNTVMA